MCVSVYRTSNFNEPQTTHYTRVLLYLLWYSESIWLDILYVCMGRGIEKVYSVECIANLFESVDMQSAGFESRYLIAIIGVASSFGFCLQFVAQNSGGSGCDCVFWLAFELVNIKQINFTLCTVLTVCLTTTMMMMADFGLKLAKLNWIHAFFMSKVCFVHWVAIFANDFDYRVRESIFNCI